MKPSLQTLLALGSTLVLGPLLTSSEAEARKRPLARFQPGVNLLKLQRTQAQPGFKRVSTAILGVGDIVAMERARNYNNAMWVARSATPNATAGGWTKGNLSSFPNLPQPTSAAPSDTTTVQTGGAATSAASTPPSSEPPDQTTQRLNTIMFEMQRAGYQNLQIVGSGPAAAVRGVKEVPGARTEKTICMPGMCE